MPNLRRFSADQNQLLPAKPHAAQHPGLVHSDCGGGADGGIPITLPGSRRRRQLRNVVEYDNTVGMGDDGSTEVPKVNNFGDGAERQHRPS